MSELDTFSCAICFCLYDNKGRTPKLLPTCGHTVCLNCLNGMLISKKINCPHGCIETNTSQDSTNFPNNWSLLYLIKYRLESNKYSDSNELKNITNEADLKAKKLQSLLSDFEAEKERLQHLVADGKKKMKSFIKEHFDEIRKSLAEMEDLFYGGVDYVFRIEEKVTNDIIKKDNAIKEECELQISDLNRCLIINKRFHNTLKKELPSFQIQKEYNRLAKLIGDREKECREFLEGFSKLFEPIFEKSQPLFNYEGELMDVAGSSISQILGLLEVKIDKDKLSIGSKFEGWGQSQDTWGRETWGQIRDTWGQNRDSCGQSQDSWGQGWNSWGKSQEAPRERGWGDPWGNGWEKPWRSDWNSEYNNFEGLKEDIRKKMRDLIKITTINLDFAFDWFSKEKFQLIKMLCLSLKNVSILNINLYYWREDKFDISFLDPFWSQEKIERFEISFSHSKLNGSMIAQIIRNSLEKLVNLKYFSANFVSTHIKDLQILALTPYVRSRLSNLLSLSLNFYNSKINHTGVTDLSSGFGDHVKKLEVLKLDFVHTKIINKSIITLSRFLIGNATNLKDFSLLIGNNQITDKIIQELCLALKRIGKNIKYFALELDKTKITDISVINLCNHVFQNMIAMERFDLSLQNTNVTDKGITLLFDKLKDRGNINKFTLNLSNTKITDNAVLRLSKDILPFMNNLGSLILSLEGIKVTDESLKFLINSLQKCPKKLDEFSLNFEETSVSEDVRSLINDYRKFSKNL